MYEACLGGDCTVWPIKVLTIKIVGAKWALIQWLRSKHKKPQTVRLQKLVVSICKSKSNLQTYTYNHGTNACSKYKMREHVLQTLCGAGSYPRKVAILYFLTRNNTR